MSAVIGAITHLMLQAAYTCMSDGLFVVIEGADGIGKGVQTERLVDWFRDQEHRKTEEVFTDEVEDDLPAGDYDLDVGNGVWYMKFPVDGTPFGDAARAYLGGVLGEKDTVPSDIPIATFAADRYQFRDAISGFLENGGILVADRYMQSNLAYQTVGTEGDTWQETVDYIHRIEDALPQPDTVFYLDVPPEESAKLREGRDGEDMYDADVNLQQEVYANYERLAEHEGWERIDAVAEDGLRSIADIQQEIRERAQQYI
jgi:dTMP kinase